MIYSDGIHVVSDVDFVELHKFAQSVGIKRCWFHSNTKYPHYDIPKSMRADFFEKTGLTKVSGRKIVEISKALKERLK